MVTARDWSCGLIDHIILKDATCKICSLVYGCEVSHDGTLKPRTMWLSPEGTVAPRICAFLKSSVCDFFFFFPFGEGDQIPYGNNTDILTHSEEGQSPSSQPVTWGYGMYC